MTWNWPSSSCLASANPDAVAYRPHCHALADVQVTLCGHLTLCAPVARRCAPWHDLRVSSLKRAFSRPPDSNLRTAINHVGIEILSASLLVVYLRYADK